MTGVSASLEVQALRGTLLDRIQGLFEPHAPVSAERTRKASSVRRSAKAASKLLCQIAEIKARKVKEDNLRISGKGGDTVLADNAFVILPHAWNSRDFGKCGLHIAAANRPKSVDFENSGASQPERVPVRWVKLGTRLHAQE